jgi:hypothetical protein
MKIHTPKTFSLEIERISLELKITHMEAVMYYCDKNNIEPVSVAKLITKGLKEKIEVNATDLNYLPRKGRLPI